MQGTRGTVWLVGMMGAGKSAVGARLARRLGTVFVDTDREIEARAGCTVAAIFAREGEAGFRRREREAVEALAGKPLVAALGGGAMTQPGVPEALEGSGVVVWLRARPETLLERLGAAEDRPLLSGHGPAEREGRLRALLAAREPAYARAALVVDTDALDPEAVAAAVVERLEAGA